MIGVNRHPWLLSRNKTQLRNSIAVSAKLSINMAYDYRHLLQILLLIFHTRDEVKKIEYARLSLLGNSFQTSLKIKVSKLTVLLDLSRKPVPPTPKMMCPSNTFSSYMWSFITWASKRKRSL